MRKLKKTKVKLLVTLLSFVLLFCGTMGSSLAWLLDKTDDVTNTFTPSTIKVGLKETSTIFKMIPGHTIDKDPVVTVAAGSEDCYVFIKVDESTTLYQYIEYCIDTSETIVHPSDTDEKTRGGWIQGTGTIPENVYYRIVNSSDADQVFGILAGGSTTDSTTGSTFTWGYDEVLTKPTVTKEMMAEIDGFDANGNPVNTETKPTLSFKAGAVQLYKSNDEQFKPKEAYNLLGWLTP